MPHTKPPENALASAPAGDRGAAAAAAAATASRGLPIRDPERAIAARAANLEQPRRATGSSPTASPQSTSFHALHAHSDPPQRPSAPPSTSQSHPSPLSFAADPRITPTSSTSPRLTSASLLSARDPLLLPLPLPLSRCSATSLQVFRRACTLALALKLARLLASARRASRRCRSGSNHLQSAPQRRSATRCLRLVARVDERRHLLCGFIELLRCLVQPPLLGFGHARRHTTWSLLFCCARLLPSLLQWLLHARLSVA
mmetsp:Transcript_8161/g.27106  ORF Transcript_8161/g.27106 Transcript_8161/m.27106 type:complete len:258 (-) Transcript_8161:8-781(-)